MQPQTGGQAAGGEAEARRAPGTERPAMQLRADVIEETYGRGFAMLAKMGYKHDNLKHTTNTPISVVSKLDKKGLYVAGEEASAGRGVNGKQQGETQGKDAVFVREWLYRLLLSCQGEYGTMEPLAMSRVPDLWSQQFSGTFPVKTLGYKKLINVLQGFNDVVKIVGQGTTSAALLPADHNTSQVLQQGASKRARLHNALPAPTPYPYLAKDCNGAENEALAQQHAEWAAAAAAADAYAQSYGFSSAAHAYAMAQPQQATQVVAQVPEQAGQGLQEWCATAPEAAMSASAAHQWYPDLSATTQHHSSAPLPHLPQALPQSQEEADALAQAQAAWQGGYHAQGWSQYGAAGAQVGQPSAMAGYSSGAYAPEATL